MTINGDHEGGEGKQIGTVLDSAKTLLLGFGNGWLKYCDPSAYLKSKVENYWTLGRNVSTVLGTCFFKIL